MLALAEAVASGGRPDRRARRRDARAEIAAAARSRPPRDPGRARCRSPLALRLAPRRRPAAPSPRARLAARRRRPRGGRRPPPARRRARQRRPRQGPVRRPRSRPRSPARAALRRELRGRPALRRRAAARRSASRARSSGGGAAHVRAPVRRRWPTSGITARSWLDPSGAPGAPPARPVHRHARVHRRRPGDRDRADRARGRAPRQGGAAQRAGRRGRWLLPHGGVVVHDDGSHAVTAGTATA